MEISPRGSPLALSRKNNGRRRGLASRGPAPTTAPPLLTGHPTGPWPEPEQEKKGELIESAAAVERAVCDKTSRPRRNGF
ncbi:unnamed protein product [Lampetra fluviatilis]